MAKIKSIWRCTDCGSVAYRWLGRCNECGQYGTLVEELEETAVAPKKGAVSAGMPAKAVLLEDASIGAGVRLSSQVSEFDRVLGGGLIEGSLTLLSGEPGIGKSTLLLQVAGYLANSGKKVLYACGEESTAQVATRAQRLGLSKAPVSLLPEVSVENIIAATLEMRPALLIVDSIQTLYTSELTGAPGSVGQVRACAGMLMRLAKEHGITTIIVGHVTKDGSVAGPRVLEHMVDAVLNFEGDKDHEFRIIRAVKNRFGSTSEIGIFEMSTEGLIAVASPSEVLIDRDAGPISGSVFFADCEGMRPLIVEVQALVTKSYLPNPRRLSNGIETLRLLQVIAVLERRAHLSFSDLDVIVSIAGGIKVSEPAVDLALALALISAHRDIALPQQTVAFGEIALTGKIRKAARSDIRIKEASNLGFHRIASSEQLTTVQDCLALFKVK